MKLHVVHYSSNLDLPKSVRDKIPGEPEQTIFRAVLNDHLGQGRSEMHSFLQAWKALRDKGIVDDSGNPIEKDSPTVGDVHVNKPLGAVAFTQGKKKKPNPLNIPGDDAEILRYLDKRDSVTFDIPLFIRLLEVAREEIKTDEPLHVIAERVVDLAEKKPELDMEDFPAIISALKKREKDDPGTEDVDVEEPPEVEKPPVEDPVDKGGPGSGGARDGAGRKPGGKNLSEKAQRALAHYRPCNADEQRIADKSEEKLSKALGIPRTGNNSAFDLRNDDVGVEVKTMLSGKNDKITMSKEALGRKMAEASAEGLKTFTVVADLRGRATARYYVSNRLGSIRLGTMTQVTLPELKSMIRGAI